MHSSDKYQIRYRSYPWGITENNRIGVGYPGDFVFAIFLRLGYGEERWFCDSLYTFCTSKILHSKILKIELQARGYLETLAWRVSSQIQNFLLSAYLAEYRTRPGSHTHNVLN